MKITNTSELRDKMLELWKRFEKGEVSAQVARTHIGFARTVIDTAKVEIAAAHVNHTIRPLSLR